MIEVDQPVVTIGLVLNFAIGLETDSVRQSRIASSEYHPLGCL